ncbi:uncharacterized protein LOC130712936 [Lotus japonicus]|uniref:uncharacterized protein LOC130712936 n=1 Tax=Lotus japonicus TaxID=34305 RepID=UPI00258D5C5B|nr:uncharacterized protein LOC130712936 [Lotus japonicus]
MTSQDHKKMTSTFMSNYILGMVSAQPTIPISLIQERISGQLNYKVSYFKAWKAKQKALARVFGDWEESYDLLPRWLEYMMRFSPGSHYEFVTTDYKDQYGNVVPDFKKFGRVFWTYKQCCDAFNYCKPMIQIDGTFLYEKYSGTLLIATTQDGNSNVLPLAFAIVEGETLGAWTWFLRLMRVHVTRKQGICLISDRHATYEPCSYLFEQRLAAFRGRNTAVRQWINGISNEKWSRACDVEGRRYGHMTTNLSEAVNKVFRDARKLPITALVKCTYGRLVEYFVQRGSAAAAQQRAGDRYCNKVMEAMTKNATVAQSHIVRTYSIDRSRFEVEEGFNQ